MTYCSKIVRSLGRLLALAIMLGSAGSALAESPAKKLSYNHDVLPILAENCFHCHGPDENKLSADLSLSNREAALVVIEPGDAEASNLIERIFDEEDPMPPVDSNRSLTLKQKEMLRDWVNQGAEYQRHWSFEPPVKESTPKLSDESLVRNPIDSFVQSRLAEEGLSPAPEAKPEVLARRASLALTGLQPTPEQMQTFLADTKPGAYERFVDQLLASDHYAERMALAWLDAARYADTDGYQNDEGRNNWPWRDWVIKAYRHNMPFDQFTIEQLAGDMLPNPTHEQKLATAFNRNHRQNGEGGALAEEFFVENVIDRVETTSTIWLGLTTGCSRCHDHKFDPISQKEFYQLFAYFNNIGESGNGPGRRANPMLDSASPLREVPPQLAKALEVAEQAKAAANAKFDDRFNAWVKQYAELPKSETRGWYPVEPAREVTVASSKGKQEVKPQADGSYRFEKYEGKKVSYTIDVSTEGLPLTGLRLDALPSDFGGEGLRFAPSGNGNFVVTKLKVQAESPSSASTSDVAIEQVTASYEQSGYDAKNLVDAKSSKGWAISGADRSKPVSLFVKFSKPVMEDPRGTLKITIEQNSPYANHTIGGLKLYLTRSLEPLGAPKEVIAAFKTPSDEWDKKQAKTARDYYATIDQPTRDADRKVQEALKALSRAGLGRVSVMVMKEQEKQHPAYILDRGQYDAPIKDEVLERTVPAALLGDRPAPKDRLELAEWLVSRDNPITARVAANRMWQQVFGRGMVKTTEDFGVQGERPANPALLDWLAIEFIDSGWDMKQFYRLLVTSHAFRQESKVTPALYERDPENRLLARGPRFRLDGFAIRDLALRAAGLLNSKVGGPPVKPYQPEGLWAVVAANSNSRGYQVDSGNKVYRKSMYTYWKRAVNPPRQTIFDASGREVCNVRQRVTNTPLQALALMNDVTFIEAARHLAERMIKQGGNDLRDRLAYGYQATTSYKASPATLDVLEENYQFFLKHFGDNKKEAGQFLAHGKSPRDKSIDMVEHAAYAATAHLMLNLDETITLE